MKFLKRFFYFLFEPIFKKIIQKIDLNITIENHLRIVSELKIGLKRLKYFSNKEDYNFKIKNLESFFFEDEDLITLNLDLISIDSSVPLNLTFKADSLDYLNIILDKLKKSQIGDTNQYKTSAKSVFRASYFILKNNLLNRKDIEILVKNITQFFPVNSWLYPNNFVYGSSNILLGLIGVKKNYLNPLTLEYINKVSERILKKMEISQQKYFHFTNSPKSKALLILEQIKIIYFLLIYYENTKDIRFLNAVLKANDRLFPFFKKLDISSSSETININSLLASYYIKVIEMQEKNFSRLL